MRERERERKREKSFMPKTIKDIQHHPFMAKEALKK